MKFLISLLKFNDFRGTPVWCKTTSCVDLVPYGQSLEPKLQNEVGEQ